MKYKNEELKTALTRIKHIPVTPEILTDILIELISDLNFSSISIIESVNRKLLMNSSLGMIFDIFMRIISDKIKKCDRYKGEEIYKRIKDVELPDEVEYEIYYYSMYAVVVGYLQPAVDRLVITQRVLDKFFAKNSYIDKKYYGVWFNGLCYLGRWLYARHNNRRFSESLSTMEEILSKVLIKEWPLPVLNL